MAPLCSEVDRHFESHRGDILAHKGTRVPMLRRRRRGCDEARDY
jgi:hypothetical protein